MVSKTRAALAGVSAAAVAIGVAELVAVWTGARSAPLIAVGGAVVDSVPEPAKQFAIALFGVHDKTALLVGTAILLAVFAALIGIAAARRRELGMLGIGLFGAIGLYGALTRPSATSLSALPTLVGAAAAVPVLFGLLRAAEAEAQPAPEPGPPPPVGQPSTVDGDVEKRAAELGWDARAGRWRGQQEPPRRNFLKWTIGALGGAALVGLCGRVWSGKRDAEVARAAVALPAPASAAPPVPNNVNPPVEGLASYVTGNDVFYRIDTALTIPQVDPAKWQLRIHGRVANPITLTFEELLKRPMVERWVTLACVSNEVGGDLLGNARWLGVAVADLLKEAGPQAGADQVVSRSVDGWTCSTPTSVLMDGRDALLAVGMNGEPLPIDHGFPARMVVPGLYGYVSACKWITELELTSFADFDAYWIRRGWAAEGPIKTQSRIDVPRHNAKVKAGDVVVAGVAWAQHRGISVVEVRVDDGPWQPAELAGTVSPDTWRQWTFRWAAATPGKHTLAVRAADVTGQVQSGIPRDVVPDGAEGWHTVSVTVQ